VRGDELGEARQTEDVDLELAAGLVDRDVLIDAQAHPERHRDLIVRVAGYSAFFVVLSKQTQDDIIARTEQTL